MYLFFKFVDFFMLGQHSGRTRGKRLSVPIRLNMSEISVDEFGKIRKENVVHHFLFPVHYHPLIEGKYLNTKYS